MSSKNSPPDDPTNSSNDLLTTTHPIDSAISLSDSRSYWSQVSATNDGMLGGYEDVTGPDLKHSKRFISQVRRILQTNPPLRIERAVDCGAGIGRITKGLLIKVAETVDVVEPIAKFAAEVTKLQSQAQNAKDGQVGDVFVEGLENWSPLAERRYALIWNQWCLGHLTDTQLVSYFRRAARALTGTSDGQEEKGWIMVKENLSKEEDGDIFDRQDSSVTRTDRNFRRIFDEAGLKVVKSGKQDNFPSELYTVMMYALRPS